MRDFLRRLQLIGFLTPSLFCCGSAKAQDDNRPNVLLLTGDDLNWDSLGVFGCPAPGITPHLDKLAGEGMRFTQAHVVFTVCGPSRTSLLTGRYPHTSGADHFHAIRDDGQTLPAVLKTHGYINGILGKENHTLPRRCCIIAVKSQ